MRQLFFVGILVFGVIAGIVYVLWTIVAALYHDWSLGRGVKQLQEESAARRAKREQEDELGHAAASASELRARAAASRAAPIPRAGKAGPVGIDSSRSLMTRTFYHRRGPGGD